jgi:hypothetical protein
MNLKNFTAPFEMFAAFIACRTLSLNFVRREFKLNGSDVEFKTFVRGVKNFVFIQKAY